MIVTNLSLDSKTYTSNAYLVTGDWKSLNDVNTLIDTGPDESNLENIHKNNMKR